MSALDQKMLLTAEQIGIVAKEKHHVVATAESCTGGLLGAALTAIPGSSEWYCGGLITYNTAAKVEHLDVNPDEIARYGVVSEYVAMAMARGALSMSKNATVSMGITGFAGPGGGDDRQPIGTVCIGWAEYFNEHVVSYARTIRVPGDREFVRSAAVRVAMDGLLDLMRFNHPATTPCEF